MFGLPKLNLEFTQLALVCNIFLAVNMHSYMLEIKGTLNYRLTVIIDNTSISNKMFMDQYDIYCFFCLHIVFFTGRSNIFFEACIK